MRIKFLWPGRTKSPELRALLGFYEARMRPFAACEVIETRGFGDLFGHGLGHGVGLEIHEAPRLNQHSDTILQPGMAVTVEPGIYIPGQGGVRIEDLVLITETGCEILTKLPKDLKVLNK